MRIVLRTVGVSLFICLGTAVHSSMSLADATSTGGGDSGSTVTVTVSSSGGSSGSPGAGGGSDSGSSAGSGPVCQYVQVPAGENAALGVGGKQPGRWYELSCGAEQFGYDSVHLVWVPDGAPAPPLPPVDPMAVALQAERSMNLPSPEIGVNPSAFSVVNLPTWLWVSPSIWHPHSVSAEAGGVTATATATPVNAIWTMGDGASVDCAGPGTPYDQALPPANQGTDCSYTYGVSSAGQPSTDGDPDDGAFVVGVSVQWNVTWTSTVPGSGGSLPNLSTTATRRVRVEQIQAIERS